MHARRSLLFNQDQAWVKKDDSGFDVTMGSYDGAEVCELIGAFILDQLEPILGRKSAGLYRDDGLSILKDASGPAADRLRKKIIKTFERLGLRITIEVNRKAVNYLDITMNLSDGTYRPYLKPNSTPIYINVKSNHPPQVLKNVPLGINRRLCSVSCNEQAFDDAKPVYQDALEASGHATTLQFAGTNGASATTGRSKKRKRGRKIIWFTPPFSQSVKTNIGKKFLGLIRKHFPQTSRLHKIFNKNTVKVGYSCTKNMATLIKGHNTALLKPKEKDLECNCRAECPLDGKCRAKNVVYEATVRTADCTKKYVGLTASEFKTRHASHKTSMQHERYANSTELSKYIWQLSNQQTEHSLSWTILERACPYSNAGKRCNLCIAEAYHILHADKDMALNKRSELVSTCRHQKKFTLAVSAVT